VVEPSARFTSIGAIFRLEAALVDAGDRALVRARGPRVHLLARYAGLDGGVPADRDRHVEVGRGGRVAVARRHPVRPLVRAGCRALRRGDVDIECVPPAITTRSMPARIEPAAVVTAVSPAAQCRLTAAPGTCSMPASIAT
jgi:hypothetical protein